MARTKKEIEEQASATEPETTGTESNPIPQTDPETPHGEVANAGMTDLELAAANTLDPDAPQTDPESGEDTGGQAAFPQTDPEWNPDGQSEPGEEGFAPQTDMESADSDTGSHTDLESAEISGERQALDAESASGPQTEFETELADDNSAQATGDDAAEGDAEPPAPSRRRRASRKKATEAQDGGEDAPAEHPEEEQSDSGQPQKLRMPGRRRQRVVSIDAERTVETDTDRLRNDLLDLVESLKSKKILTGTIQGVERLADNPEMSYAVIYHGDFKVIIPVLEAIEEPADYRGQPKGDVLHYLLNKRLGAEVDYIVKGVDQEHNVVAASRLEAMALKRREYYFRTDRDGNYQIYEGIRAEARVRRGVLYPSQGTVLPAVGRRRAALPARPARAGAGAGGGPQRPQPPQSDRFGEAGDGEPLREGAEEVCGGKPLCGYREHGGSQRRVRLPGRRYRLPLHLPQARPPAQGRQGNRAHSRDQPRKQPDLGRHHPYVHDSLRREE